jgi:hypothetical protein
MSNVETLDYLDKVLSGLKARYATGDKSVEAKLRAVSLKIDRLKLQKETSDQTKKKTLIQKMSGAIRRRGCCR